MVDTNWVLVYKLPLAHFSRRENPRHDGLCGWTWTRQGREGDLPS